MCQRLMCQKREFTVRSIYCEVDPKLKNENFVRIDMKHSYFRTICLQSIFSVVKIVVVSKNLFSFMINFCSCCIKKFKVTNLTWYMYLFIENPTVVILACHLFM